ncbi:hypothetical protein [uncultured Rhodoblastus sp.]|uniref:hypothetical protein n=1 Tax=uncultured Rhodoblastus sp. TaxID=543037 RepID=UPI0025FD5388|nr:hypothetical protein [uncultured Rhodoblastus sp.]
MRNRPWFAARSPAGAGVHFVQTLFAPWFRPPPVQTPTPRLPSDFADYGAEDGWTASLHRGDGLPPFLLCIDMAAGACAAMRFEPFARRSGNESRVREL